MALDKIINQARIFTKKGMLSNAMIELQNAFPDNFPDSNNNCSLEIVNFYNDLTHLSSRYNSLDKERNKGVLEPTEARTEENKISKCLIILIENMNENKKLFLAQNKTKNGTKESQKKEQSPSIKEPKSSDLEITINRDFNNFTEKDKLNFLFAISKFLEMDECDIKIKKKYPGSVKLWVEIPEEKVELLYDLFDRGLLEILSVENISQIDEESIFYNKNEEKIKKSQKSVNYSTTPKSRNRYSDQELDEFEKIIDVKLREAQEQLDFYLSLLSNKPDKLDSKIKGLDDGIDNIENERISIQAGRLRKHIQHLENAKLRIKKKIYGICRVSGKLISKERLKAVPHATLSIEGKSGNMSNSINKNNKGLSNT